MTQMNYSICKKKAKTNLKNYASMCYLLTNAKTHNWVNFASGFSLKRVKRDSEIYSNSEVEKFALETEAKLESHIQIASYIHLPHILVSFL